MGDGSDLRSMRVFGFPVVLELGFGHHGSLSVQRHPWYGLRNRDPGSPVPEVQRPTHHPPSKYSVTEESVVRFRCEFTGKLSRDDSLLYVSGPSPLHPNPPSPLPEMGLEETGGRPEEWKWGPVGVLDARDGLDPGTEGPPHVAAVGGLETIVVVDGPRRTERALPLCRVVGTGRRPVVRPVPSHVHSCRTNRQ